MSQSRMDTNEVDTFQEVLYSKIAEIISYDEKNRVTPEKFLFINTKYNAVNQIQKKLADMLEGVELQILSEKRKHKNEWDNDFKSNDEQISSLKSQREKKASLINFLEKEYKTKKTKINERKKRIREEREKIGGDEQRAAMLAQNKRTELIADSEARLIELNGEKEAVENKAGCCGLSKKQKKQMANINARIAEKEQSKESIMSKKDSEITLYDKEYEKLKIKYSEAKKQLQSLNKEYPDRIRKEKDKLDKIDEHINEQENIYQFIRNRFASYVSNSLMASLLGVYVCYTDFVNEIDKIDSESEKLAEFKRVIAKNQQEIDRAFSILWAPHSKDMSALQFYQKIMDKPEYKQALLRGNQEVIAKLIPARNGNILNRLKRGDITGVDERDEDVLANPVTKEVRSHIALT